MVYKHKNEFELSLSMSGVIILMMSIIDNVKDKSNSNQICDNEIYNTIKRCTSDSLSSYDHNGTSCYSYSFENKALHGNVNGSPGVLYANKKVRTTINKLTLITMHTSWNLFVHPQ